MAFKGPNPKVMLFPESAQLTSLAMTQGVPAKCTRSSALSTPHTNARSEGSQATTAAGARVLKQMAKMATRGYGFILCFPYGWQSRKFMLLGFPAAAKFDPHIQLISATQIKAQA